MLAGSEDSDIKYMAVLIFWKFLDFEQVSDKLRGVAFFTGTWQYIWYATKCLSKTYNEVDRIAMPLGYFLRRHQLYKC